jgi:formamidopyrimidine-DNA glycosylase
MPELPEVETIKRELFQKIKGKKIVSVEVLTPKTINCSADKFKKIIENSKIKDVQRRAKLLIIKLSNNYNLAVHLKLTGQFIYKLKTARCDLPEEKYARLIFTFQNNDKSDTKSLVRDKLFFNDLRKFAFVKLLNDKKLEELLTEKDFGPEPLDKSFTLKIFQSLLFQKKKTKIKPLLMNQNFLAGVGNIYAAESCFCAKILPTRLAGSLTKEEIKKLYQCLRKILKTAIIRKGSSVNQYVDVFGKKGNYVSLLKVYAREGKICLRCGSKIKKINLNGRGTCFCPNCQK